MKVFFIALLAIIIVPLIFAFFQNARYENKLKPTLLAEARELVSSSGMEGVEVQMEKLDVSLSGIAGSKEDVTELTKSIDALGGGAVRIKTTDESFSVYGDMNVQKIGDELTIAGQMKAPSSFIDQLNSTSIKSIGKVKASSELKAGEVYRDSTVLENDQLAEWSASHLTIKGDRGYKVSASDNVIRPYGDVTPGLKKMLIGSAEEKGLALDPSGLKVVAAEQVKFDLTNSGGKKSITGKGPKSVDLAAVLKADKSKLKTDDFVDAHPSVASPKFHKWVGSFFSAKGDRGVHVDHDQVTLTGPATASQEKQWVGELASQGLKPVSKLSVAEPAKPAPVVGNPSDGGNGDLLKAFTLNQVFFDSSSSAVRADQQSKITALASAISSAGQDVRFIIGGHADASGNAEFNKQLSKKRAAAVVAELAKKGISSKKFSVVSFGAAKASSASSKESARKVEIRIK